MNSVNDNATAAAPLAGLTQRRRSEFQRPHYLLFLFDNLALVSTAIFFYLMLNNARDLEHGLAHYLMAILVALATHIFYGFASGSYDWRRYHEQISRPLVAFGGLMATVGALLSIGFILKETGHFSRLWISSWFIAFSLYILVSRVFLAWYLSRLSGDKIHHRNAIILGAGEQGHGVYRHICQFKGHGVRVIGFVDDRDSRLPENTTELPLLGSTDYVEKLIRDHGVDLIIIAMPWSAFGRIRGLLQKLANWAVDIYMAPDHLGLLYANRPVYRIGGMHVLSLKDRPISEWAGLTKRVEDLVIAVPAVILLSPLLVLIALAIKLESKGPVLFIQERFGFHNDIIRVFKFRSMYVEMTDAHADQQTTRHDPRVTRVGRLIRRTSLDELPQLFNVIRGCMSMVGPRPHACHTKAGDQLFQEAVDIYASRHRVKPGITGWAQCNGWRGETDTHEKLVKRVEHDLYYIDNWSIFLDILIILKTIVMLFKKDKNAY